MSEIKTLDYDLLRVKIFPTREQAGLCAAKEGAAVIRSLLAEKDCISIIFAAAPSQNDTLYELTRQPDIDWTRVHAFHMDEYIGLNSAHPQSFACYLNEHIFGLLPFRELHYINGSAEDTQGECERYANLLRQYPADIVFLGIGENGHLAFNDPGVADFNDKALVKAVPLDEVCRTQQVHDGCFASLSDVPTHALTLTIPALTAAGHLFCTVPRASKAQAVYRTITGPISEDCPASIMRKHPDAVMYCDTDSGSKLL
ncbi:MAG: glucosamine-6-phosphate deaminase [Eubacteriales bacterium]